MKFFGRVTVVAGLLFLGLFLVGCVGTRPDPYQYNPLAETNASTAIPELAGTNATTNDIGAYIIAVGDDLTVSFNDVTPVIPPITDTIKDDDSTSVRIGICTSFARNGTGRLA